MYGMVKPAEDDDDYLLFAHRHLCENWFRIPMSSIEDIGVLGFMPCDDNKHPVFSLGPFVLVGRRQYCLRTWRG